ncbi:MAG TPA: ABC transporter permease [Acidobacteriota bacterium]|nr:ABC transporter permease [Acidobacteriota bacterium]
MKSLKRRVRLDHHRLAQAIARSGRDQNDWADELEISRGYFSQLVHGHKCHPGPEVRRKLLRGLGLDFDELFLIEGGEPASSGWRGPRSGPPPADKRGQGRSLAVGSGLWWGEIGQSLRSLLRRPAFSAVAVLTLAAGIGANALLFSAVHAVLLQPYPYPEAERVVDLYESNEARGWAFNSVSPPNYLDFKEGNRTFEALAAYQVKDVNFSTGQFAERVTAVEAPSDFFAVLGVQPERGRFFHTGPPSEEEDLLVISHTFWRSRLGGDPQVLGSAVDLDGRRYTIAGVLPAGIDFPSPQVQLYTPMSEAFLKTQGRGGRYLRVVGRLKQGVRLSQAQSDLAAIAQGLQQAYPESNADWSVTLTPHGELSASSVRRPLMVLWLTTGLVLLIACANLANLLLGQAASRRRELAVRLALGAGRKRLTARLLTESLLLSLCGAAVGLLLAALGAGWLTRWASQALPRAQDISVNWTVAGFTLLLASAATVLFGWLPSWRAARLDPQAGLGAGPRATSAQGGRLRYGLIVAEVALALTVLVGAGLLLRSLSEIMGSEAGFESRNLLTLRVEPGMLTMQPGQDMVSFWNARQEQRDVINDFYGRLLARLQALPGVQRASAVNRGPLEGSWWGTSFRLDGRAPVPRNQQPTALTRVVMPGYFRTMGIDLMRGRVFLASDRRDAQHVAVIDQALARANWPGESPLGQRITLNDPEDPFVIWYTVVGVVDDISHHGLGQTRGGTLYLHFPQAIFGHFGDWGMDIAIRHQQGAGPGLASAVRAVVRELDPSLPVFQVRTGEDLLAQDTARRRLQTLLLAAFGALALILCASGIFSVVSYSVASRRREIGIRRALGARGTHIYRRVLSQGLLPVALGILLGLPAAWALTLLLQDMLFHVQPYDPPTLLLSCLALLLLGAAAALLPAYRANQINPLSILRSD